MIGLLFAAIVGGLIIGALGRLVVPGRNPIGLPMTIGLGIVGSVGGFFVARALHLGGVLQFILAVVIAALLVAAISGSATRNRRGVI